MLSVNRILLSSSILVIVIALSLGIFTRNIVFSEFEAKQQEDLNLHTMTVSKAIELKIKHKQAVVYAITKNNQFLNDFEILDTKDLITRTTLMRDLIPDAVGLAIFDRNGNIIGNAHEQRIGTACLLSTKHIAKNFTLNNSPPIHDFMGQREHFDVTMPFETALDQYYLLVSFKLDILNDALSDFSNSRYYYHLTDHQQLNIAELGIKGKDVLTETVIPGTQWILKTESPHSALIDALKYPTRYFLFLALFLLLSAIVIAKVINTYLKKDLTLLHSMITHIESDNDIIKHPVHLSDLKVLQSDIHVQATELQRSRQELEQQSISDPLTGIGNRRLMNQDLKTFQSLYDRGTPVSLAMIDLNYFKLVNDELGHAAGDKFLIDIAALLKQNIRDSDGLYRLGGDEFLVILAHSDLIQAQIWKQNLVSKTPEVLAQNNDINQLKKPVGISIGVAECNSNGILKTLERADAAMYSDKQTIKEATIKTA